jgi:hypothetical protein
VTPTPPPWDSPQVEIRKTLPKVFPVPIVRVNPVVRVGVEARERERRRKEDFRFIVVQFCLMNVSNVDVMDVMDVMDQSARNE